MIFKLNLVQILVAVLLINCTSADGPPATNPPTPPPANNQPPTNSPPAPGVNSDAFIPSENYPTPRRDEKVQDTYPGGVVVKDPYRWMEVSDSPETKKFIDEEMAITTAYLKKSPFRDEMTARYKELYDYPTFHGLIPRGKYFFSYQNTGLQNQDVAYVHNSLKDEGKVLLDPNTLDKDGTIAIDTIYSSFSNDGLVYAYMLSFKGSDWKTIQFLHVEKGDIYKEKLTKVKFSDISWSKDNKGIFYECYPDHKGDGDGSNNDELEKQKLFYHVLGTEQSKDILVAEFPENPDYNIDAVTTDDGKYLLVMPSGAIGSNLVYFADLEKINYEIKGKLRLEPVVTKMEANYYVVTNVESVFFFHTNKDADNYKIIAIDFAEPDPSKWEDIVHEDKKNALDWAHAAGDKHMMLAYVEDVKHVLQLHDLRTGKMMKKLQLEIGKVREATYYTYSKSQFIFFNFESFLTPGIVYKCDLSKPSFDLEVFKETKIKNFDITKYETEQKFFPSKDGTMIPMYLVHKKGLEKNGNNFSYMTAYGGFSISRLPYFAPNRLLIIDNFGGIHITVNIRGGGEYGEKWHKGGSLHNKQNSFDDFQAAAEYVIKEKYTTSKLLAIWGGSNGGLLMGACLNQRPDLFGAVVADAGVLDMLRFDKFTGGKAWVDEYGSPHNPKDFPFLFKYSPLHNVNIAASPNKQYPPTLLTTSDHDDRVPPLHSLKMIATLQFAAKNDPNQKNPLIIRVEKDAGHNTYTSSKSKDKEIAELVDEKCFFVINMGIKFHT